MQAFGNFVSASTLAVSVIGLAFIWFQVRQAANSSKASLLISINRDLNGYSDIAILIERHREESWAEALSELETERLLDYISYFEGLYLAHARGLFTLREVNDYFSGRLFRLANNEGVQKAVLLNSSEYGDIFRPIYCLHKKLSDYRRRNELPRLYSTRDLSLSDPAYYAEMIK